MACCVVCGDEVAGGVESVLDDRGRVALVRKVTPQGPVVCLWCLPVFVARGGRLAAEGTVRREVDREVVSDGTA